MFPFCSVAHDSHSSSLKYLGNCSSVGNSADSRAEGLAVGQSRIFSFHLNEEMNQVVNKNKSKKSRSLAISCRQKRYHITF